jgi:hypothetical protein
MRRRADGDEHRAPMPLAIARADAAVSPQQHDDGRRIDDCEHMRQLMNDVHGVNRASSS